MTNAMIQEFIEPISIWDRVIELMLSSMHQNHCTSYDVTRNADGSTSVSIDFWNPSSSIGTNVADSLSDAVVLLYNGDPVCDQCGEWIGNEIQSPKTATLKALSPRVEYVNDWKNIPNALSALPPGSIFGIGGTKDDLSSWAPGGTSAMTAAWIASFQSWISAGGRYLGICGGAIVAQAVYDDGPGSFSFPAMNVAPVLANNFANDNAQERIENIAWKDGQTYGIFFQEGSYMELQPTTELYEIQGTYLPMTTPIAHDGGGISTILFTYGRGKVYISGVHLEATADYWTTAPAGYVAHTELLEGAVVDLLSNRVPSGTAPALPTVETTTHRTDVWGVPMNNPTVSYTYTRMVENSDNSYPDSALLAGLVPVINTHKNSRTIEDVIQLMMGQRYYFDYQRVSRIEVVGYPGLPLGFSVKVSQNPSGENFYTFIPMKVQSGGKVRCNWYEATHMRVKNESLNIDERHRLPRNAVRQSF